MNRSKLVFSGIGIVAGIVVALALVTPGPGRAGLQPPPGSDALRVLDFFSEKGECVTVSNPLVEPPDSVPAAVRTGGGLVDESAFVGTVEDAIAAFGATKIQIDDTAAVWAVRPSADGDEAIQLAELSAGDGTSVWLITTRIHVSECPNDV